MRLRTLSYQQAAPPAGQGFVLQFSPIERVRVRSLVFQFAADATVANRFVWAQVTDPNGNVTFETGYPTAITLSTTVGFTLGPTFGNVVTMQGKTVSRIGLPLPEYWLPPQWAVTVGATGIDPADQFSGISYAADYGEDAWSKAEQEAEYQQYLAALT